MGRVTNPIRSPNRSISRGLVENIFILLQKLVSSCLQNPWLSKNVVHLDTLSVCVCVRLDRTNKSHFSHARSNVHQTIFVSWKKIVPHHPITSPRPSSVRLMGNQIMMIRPINSPMSSAFYIFTLAIL